MKTFLKLLPTACLMAVVTVSCFNEAELLNKINGLDSRIAALEEQMRTANQNISSLQTITQALQKNVFVNTVVQTEGGYTIKFSDGTTADIVNGKDGSNGSDGSTPSIGVKQDTDGVYYWTLNGAWLLDAQNNKVRVTGEDGAQGMPGSDAIAPKLKIEQGYWYISTDGGNTWEQLDKATGEDGDSWFKDVTWDDNFVYLTLADDTLITLRRGEGLIFSIAVVPDYDDGYVKAGTGLFTLRFKVDPANVAEQLLELADTCFRLDATYTLTKAYAGDLTTLPIHEKVLSDPENGIITITTTGNDLDPEFASRKLGVNAALFIFDGNALAVNTGFFPLWLKNEYMGHTYVDLGLESGLVWAETNFGAENPWEPGYFLSWGESEPKDHYSWDNYIWCEGTEESLTKYNKEDGALSYADYDYEDDPVRAAWGGEWRTPTWEDWEELLDKDKYSWTWTSRNGRYGYEVRSKIEGHKDNSIFLPAYGWMNGTENRLPDSGYYWSADLCKGDEAFVFVLGFGDTGAGQGVWGRRTGLLVHPVLGTPKKPEIIEPEAVDLGLPSGVKWANMNVGATSPEGAGDMFAWGETEPKYLPGHALDDPCTAWKPGQELGYAQEDYKWGCDPKNLTKYYPNDDCTTFKDYDYEDDAARANWQGEWRTPTMADFEELMNEEYCDWTFTTEKGVNGYRITSKIPGYTDKSIFLPENWQRHEAYLYHSASYWTADNGHDVIASFKYYTAHALTFSRTDGSGLDFIFFLRSEGHAVRPVLGEPVNTPGPGPEEDYVDLGLSVKWRKCNLGAAKETDFGDYFAWGETEPYYQDGYAVDENALWKPGKEAGYDRNSYRWIDGNDLLKYCPDVTGAPDLTVLAPEDDAATAILGEGWRIPTPEEIDELLDPDFCTMAPEAIETSNETSVIGVRFTGIKTGESIFIPFAGHRRSISFFADLEGGIWTSSVAQGDPEDYQNAIRLAFYGADEPDTDTFLRWFGLPIRPVWTK